MQHFDPSPLRVLSLACLTICLALQAAPGQVVINEVQTGTPDYIELRNLGQSPVNIGGWVVATWQTTTTVLSAEGQFTIPAGTTIPAEGFFVLQETGTPGTAGTIGACSMRVGINYNWTNTRTIVVALTNAGQGVDYFFRNASGVVGTPNLPAGTTWSGTFSSTGDSIVRTSNSDTNAASDWGIAAAGSPCALNPGQSFIPPVDFFLASQGLGDVVMSITTNPPRPNREFYTLVSGQILSPLGSGAIFGVGLDVLPQFGWAAFAGNPFHSNLSGTGFFGANYGPGALPLGLTVQAVVIVLDSGDIIPSQVRQVTF
jgi:hypothetical protein